MLYVRHPVLCNDGTTLSIQASAYHWCTPRNNEGPYTHVEVWWPDADEPTGDVPIEAVNEYIKQHGGLVILQPHFMR